VDRVESQSKHGLAQDSQLQVKRRSGSKKVRERFAAHASFQLKPEKLQVGQGYRICRLSIS